jgi:hypothetical protein
MEEGHSFGEVGDLYVVGSASLGCHSPHAMWADLSHHKPVEHDVSEMSSDIGAGKERKTYDGTLNGVSEHAASFFQPAQIAGFPFSSMKFPLTPFSARLANDEIR